MVHKAVWRAAELPRRGICCVRCTEPALGKGADTRVQRRPGQSHHVEQHVAAATLAHGAAGGGGAGNATRLAELREFFEVAERVDISRGAFATAKNDVELPGHHGSFRNRS